MDSSIYFDGLSSNFNDFIDQFELLAALNNWDEKIKKIVIKAYLSGSALICYKTNITPTSTYENIVDILKKEFASVVDYASQFYMAKQLHTESVIEYIFRLEFLAKKAEIVSHEIIIKQILSTLTFNNKKNFATNVYKTLDELKCSAKQHHELFNSSDVQLTLPVKISSLGTQNPCSHSLSRGDCQNVSRSAPSAHFRNASVPQASEEFSTPLSSRVRFTSPPLRSGPVNQTYAAPTGATSSRAPQTQVPGSSTTGAARGSSVSSRQPQRLEHDYNLRSRYYNAGMGRGTNPNANRR